MQYFKQIAALFSFSILTMMTGLQAQEVSLDIIESAGGCGLATDCPNEFICFDIRMTVDEDKNLDSYNIWVQYDNAVLSRVVGGDDASCVLADGGDTDIEAQGAYRVAGIPGSPFPMTAGVQETVHTICFAVTDPGALDGSVVLVGGNLFNGALPTSITFDDTSTDDVPEETPLALSQATLTCLEPLPVELLSFEAERRGNTVELLWETANEYNNAHFEIERSTDRSHFSMIGKVESKGNSSNHQQYSSKDLNPVVGDNFYRLKQVDFDGQYSYSEIRSVKFDSNNKIVRGIEVYPNPTVDFVQVTFEKVNGDATINVLNALGEIVDTVVVEQKETGLARQKIDLSDYPEGAYFIQLIQGDQTEMTQVVRIN